MVIDMASKQEQYVWEYLNNVEGSTGLHAYNWNKLDDGYLLVWMLGKYSYDMKANCERYAKQLLSKYPGVFILIDGGLMTVSDHQIVPDPVPVIPEPKPPVFVTCLQCQGIGKVQMLCPTCKHNTLDIVCPECGGTGKVLA